MNLEKISDFNEPIAEFESSVDIFFKPVEIISLALRIGGLNFDENLLGDRLSQTFKIVGEGLETQIGLQRNPKSDFKYDGEKLINSNIPAKILDNIAFNFLLRGWRPDFYFKGKETNGKINPDGILNINFSQYCNNRCAFCVRTYMNDSPEQYPAVTQQSIQHIISRAAATTADHTLKNVEQISIVSGLKQNENEKHGFGETLKLIFDQAKDLGFQGRILYAGYQINQKDLELIVKNIPNFVWYKTIESFANRNQIMPSPKGTDSIQQIIQELKQAQKEGVMVSYFYIAGLDSLLEMERQMEALKFVDEPPNVSLFEAYNPSEINIKDPEYKSFPYQYIKKAAAIIIDNYHPHGIDRTKIDSTSGLWMPQQGLIQPHRAYVIGDYWKKQKIMGQQGLVQIVN